MVVIIMFNKYFLIVDNFFQNSSFFFMSLFKKAPNFTFTVNPTNKIPFSPPGILPDSILTFRLPFFFRYTMRQLQRQNG